jgi:methionyl aminopeptidase
LNYLKSKFEPPIFLTPKAIEVCAPGVPLNHIGNTISAMCHHYGYESVKEFMGHGIGPDLHQLP